MSDLRKARIGRPLKEPMRKRIQLGLLVTAKMKRYLVKASEQSGRTQSQEAELLLEIGRLARDGKK
jgi:hypothetical protein